MGKKKLSTRLIIGIGFGSCVFIIILIIILITVFGSKTTNNFTSNLSKISISNATTNTNETTNSQTTETKIQYVFDIPTLIGKNIDEIRNILGEPEDKEYTEPTQEQISLGIKKWDNNFKKDDKELMVTFDIQSRKAIEFFISTDDPSGKTQDKKHLLELGNLSDDNTTYTVNYIKTLQDPTSFTGVTATPK